MSDQNSEDKVLQKIQEEDKKAKGKFVAFCVVGGFFGGICGAGLVYFMLMLEKRNISFVELWSQLQINGSIVFRYVLVVVGIILLLSGFVCYKSAKKMWKDKENAEENWEKIEKKLEMALLFTNILNISQNILFALSTYMLATTIDNNLLTLVMTLFGYMFFIFAGLGVQRGSINLTKEMNPEKKGSVFDMKFTDKWYKSCDEAERIQIGIASYKAFIINNYCCCGIVVVLTLLCMEFELGMLPVICVGIVWLTQTIVYQVYAFKTGKMLKEDSQEK